MGPLPAVSDRLLSKVKEKVITSWLHVLADLIVTFQALATVWGRHTRALSFVRKCPAVVLKDKDH